MKKRNQIIHSMILIMIIFLVPVLLFAQPDDPGEDVDIPIDGGLSILLAAGAGYVVKKGYDRKKRKDKGRNEHEIGE